MPFLLIVAFIFPSNTPELFPHFLFPRIDARFFSVLAGLSAMAVLLGAAIYSRRSVYVCVCVCACVCAYASLRMCLCVNEESAHVYFCHASMLR